MIARLFFAFIASLIGLYTSSQAQSYSVGETSLEELEGPYIELAVDFRNNIYHPVIFANQSCLNTLVIGQRKWLNRCIGLKDPEGELVKVRHYSEALNLMDRLGWKLVHVIPYQNNGNTNIDNTRFLLTNKP